MNNSIFNIFWNVYTNTSTKTITLEELMASMKIGDYPTGMQNPETGMFYTLKEITEKARKAGKGTPEYDEIKKQMPAITPHAFFPKNVRKAEEEHELTDLLMLDFDKIPEGVYDQIGEKIKQISSVYIALPSLSMQGFHVLLRVKNLTDAIFKVVYDKMALFISSIIGVPHDKSCSDITRLMIINYAPDLYVNENSEVIDANEVMAILNSLNAIPADGSIGLQKYLNKVDQDVAMIPGVRHRNLLAFITPRLNRAGFEKETVIEECVTRYSEPDFQRKEITEIIEYIYEHNKDEFGKNKKAYSFKQRLVETLKGQKAQNQIQLRLKEPNNQNKLKLVVIKRSNFGF